MRKIVVLRGHQGSGKTHLINQLGLEQWSVSADTIRSLLGSPVLTADGRLMVNHDVNKQAIEFMLKTIDTRMGRGETLVIDTTLMTNDASAFQNLADKHRYKLAFVDLATIPIELAIERQ